MNAADLNRMIREIEPLEQHLDFLLRIARPSVDIQLSEHPATDGCSRFGGDPFVPVDFRWPAHDEGEYRFLGQIDFGEIVDRPSELPAFGLLSIFYAYDEDGNVFWGDDGYVRAFYWPDVEGHRIVNSPTDEDMPKARRIELAGGLRIPGHSELRDDWPFDTDLLYELAERIDPSSEYLLGYPSFNTLAYDPTPGPEWISLLTVYSLDEFDWCWHDGDTLMVFIEAEKLASRDFSDLKSDAG